MFDRFFISYVKHQTMKECFFQRPGEVPKNYNGHNNVMANSRVPQQKERQTPYYISILRRFCILFIYTHIKSLYSAYRYLQFIISFLWLFPACSSYAGFSPFAFHRFLSTSECPKLFIYFSTYNYLSITSIYPLIPIHLT